MVVVGLFPDVGEGRKRARFRGRENGPRIDFNDATSSLLPSRGIFSRTLCDVREEIRGANNIYAALAGDDLKNIHNFNK